jgi:preprotein translocase subunit SecY
MAKKPNMSGEGVGAGLGELKSRLLFLLFAILVYRIGTHIPVPVLPRRNWRKC